MSPAAPPEGLSTDSSTSRGLFARARLGDPSALGRLIAGCLPDLRRWTRRRLLRWARTAVDTSDVLQDVMLHTLRRAGAIELGGRQALAAYLRTAVQNRLRDEHRLLPLGEPRAE